MPLFPTLQENLLQFLSLALALAAINGFMQAGFDRTPNTSLDSGSLLLRMFSNNLKLAVAAYNAGERAVAKHGNRIPPYRETKAYVPKLLTYYKHYRTNS